MNTLKEILDLSQKLIKLDTNPEHTSNLELALDIIKTELKWFKVESYERKNCKSILIHNKKKLPDKFRVIFNCHLDIIPAKKHQFKPFIKAGRLYGAGSMDMKSNLACALYVFKNIAKKVDYPLWIQFVTDEEIWWYNGTKYQVESWLKSEFVIATEPTNLNIAYQAKWVLQCEIHASWITAHSAYPWNGENALEKMLTFLEIFKKVFSNPVNNTWQTTYNIANINCDNMSYNKIPDNCSVKIDIRFIPEDYNSIKDKLEKIIPNDFTLKIYAYEPPLATDKYHPDIKTILNSCSDVTNKEHTLYWANWTSDARHFLKNWIEFWPIWWGIWTDEEWVDLESLEVYYRILENYLLEIDSST